MRTRALFLALALSLGACGGGNEAKNPSELKGASSMDAVDKDPVVLLPSTPVLAGTVDVRATLDHDATAAQAAALVDQYFPLGQEAGFTVSKDVDRVIFASYSTQGVDVVAVLSGRFDVEKIAAAAKNHTPTKSGGLIVESTYADHTLYTVNNIGFTVLSSKTVLAGTEQAIRRALERVKDGRLTRAFFPWMMDTLETKGAAFALAGDFANQPLSPQMIQGFSLPFVKGIKVARVVGDFEPPGLHVAGTVTYDDENGAAAGAANLQKLGAMANGLAAISGMIPQMQDLKVQALKTDVQVSFGLDDQGMKSFLSKAPQLFGS